MTNVLFNRETLKAVGLNRPALPFEVEIKDVDVSDLTKTVSYTEVVEKEGFYLYPPPAEVTYEDGSEVIEVPGEDGEPVMIEVTERVPLLDEEGNQVTYFNEAGYTVECFTTETKEVQKTNEQGEPLVYSTVYKAIPVITEYPAEEITVEDERYTEGLAKATEEVSRSRYITFTESVEEFTYDDVVLHKEKQILKGTFYASAKLVETMDESLFSTGLSTFQADLGFDFISLPAGGQARTEKLSLPNPSNTVGFRMEAPKGIEVSIGHLASNLSPLDSHNEVVFPAEVSEVYVQFKNTTDKRIEVHSFALLV